MVQFVGFRRNGEKVISSKAQLNNRGGEYKKIWNGNYKKTEG